jgi:formiminotetrahydrofolate cyclodeaminase
MGRGFESLRRLRISRLRPSVLTASSVEFRLYYTSDRQQTALQQRLLELVDEDADAFRAYLASDARSAARGEAAKRATAVPLAIGRTCSELVELATDVQSRALASLRQDVPAARRALAEAASRSALDIEPQAGLSTRSTLRL